MSKRKGAPADPEFVAYIEAQQAIHRTAFLARRSAGTGKPDGQLDPDYNKPSPLHVVPPSPRHVHDDSCLGAPHRYEIKGVWWWVRTCRVAGEIGLRPVSRNDGDSPGPPASWWTQLGEGR